MKRLIVNADDFGMSESINKGILESHTRGIVTATTWLANGHAASQAARLAPESLDVGLHLALQDVSPLSDADSFNGLLTSTGCFPAGHWPIVSWILRNRRARVAVRREWLAQVAHFENTFGQPPTHIDSHKHVALLPPLQDLLLDVAQRSGSTRVRTPVEASLSPSSLIFSALGKRLRKKANASNLPETDAFFGYRESSRLTQKRLEALLHRVLDGLTEVMVHPGSRNEPGGYQRKTECAALTSEETRRLIDALGILLVRPSELT